jgi:hypothetical protein
MSRGKKGVRSAQDWNHRNNLVKRGRASHYIPRYTLEEAIIVAGL